MRVFPLLHSAACAFAMIAAATALPAAAQTPPDHAALAERTLGSHIFPGIARFSDAADALAAAADCSAPDPAQVLRAPWGDAFLAWTAISHLQLGPIEEEGRTLSISLWPDSRGFTRRTVERLVAEEDPIADDPPGYADVSVAGRGLMALHHLIYVSDQPLAGYRCRLATTIAIDLANTAQTVESQWQDPWAGYFRNPGQEGNPIFLAPEEATRELFQSMMTGFQILIEQRLSLPLGTFEKPRPKRAEAYASGASLDAIKASLGGIEELTRTAFFPTVDEESQRAMGAAFERAKEVAGRVDPPLTDAVSDPAKRIRVEALRIAVVDLRERVGSILGPRLDVSIGFNSMDGD
ncbi:MAG: imelysin family protein [Pseudomonadota bacterium]